MWGAEVQEHCKELISYEDKPPKALAAVAAAVAAPPIATQDAAAEAEDIRELTELHFGSGRCGWQMQLAFWSKHDDTAITPLSPTLQQIALQTQPMRASLNLDSAETWLLQMGNAQGADQPGHF